MRPPQCGLRFTAAAIVAVYESVYHPDAVGSPLAGKPTSGWNPPPAPSAQADEHGFCQPMWEYIERVEKWRPETVTQEIAKARVLELLRHLDGCEECETP